MRRLSNLAVAVTKRILSLLLSAMLVLLGCPDPNPPLGLVAGLREYQDVNLVSVPGGQVNVAGGNLVLARTDLSIDTRLGTYELTAHYNSQSELWTWNFDMTYDGALFVDETGAYFDVSALPDGSPIPGSHWSKVDGSTIATRGGVVFAFDPASTLVDNVHWASSDFPRLVYVRATVAGTPHVVEMQQCNTPTSGCTSVFTISHDESGRVVSVLDRAGRQAEFAWDTDGKLSVARDALDTARGWAGFRYEYSGTKLVAITNSENERIEYTYTGKRLTSATQVGEESPVHHLYYEGANSSEVYTTRYVDPVGEETRYRYDDQGRLLEVEQMSTGELTSRSWSDLRPAQMTDPAGTITSWLWVDDALASETRSSGNVISYTYAPGAVDRDHPLQPPVLHIDDSIGLVESRTYDASGRLTSTTNGAGETRTFTYKNNEMIDTITQPDGVVVEFSGYGDIGRPTTIATGSEVVERQFDTVGNRNHGSDGIEPEAGGVIWRYYDEDRNLTGLDLADYSFYPFPGTTTTETISISYRSDHRRTAIQRPGGGDHELVYDAIGRLSEIREKADGVWHSTLFEYDAAGRRTATEKANGMRDDVAYDAAGRPVGMSIERSGTVEGTATMTYTNGRLTSVYDSIRGGAETYVWDTTGRISAIVFPDGELMRIVLDARSRPVEEAYYNPDLSELRSIERDYDLSNRVVEVRDDGVPVLTRTYQGGHEVAIGYGNGLSRTFSYNPLYGRLSGSSTVDVNGQVVETTQVTQEPDPETSFLLRLRALTTTSGGVDATTDEKFRLGPITDPNLPGVRIANWDWGADGNFYSHDTLSNLTETGDGLYHYNAERNRLTSVDLASGTVSYEYDDAGFVTSRDGQPLTWTANGKLAAVGQETSFQWDVRGNLISMSHLGETTNLLFGGRVQADANGTPTALDLGAVRIDLTSGDHLYRHYDFRGNVKFLSDESGAIVTHYLYGPYGVKAVFGADLDNRAFADRTGVGDLVVMGARIYDRLVGRFLSPDPILRIVNQYSYTLGNPIWFSDRDGTAESGNGSGGSGGKAAGTRFALNVIGLWFQTGAGLVFMGGPEAAGIAAVLLLIGFALQLGGQVCCNETSGRPDPSPNPSPTPNPPSAPPSQTASPGFLSGGSGSSMGTSGGCSPAALTDLPDFGWMLCVLVPLQLLLGALALRRRRRRT